MAAASPTRSSQAVCTHASVSPRMDSTVGKASESPSGRVFWRRPFSFVPDSPSIRGIGFDLATKRVAKLCFHERGSGASQTVRSQAELGNEVKARGIGFATQVRSQAELGNEVKAPYQLAAQLYNGRRR